MHSGERVEPVKVSGKLAVDDMGAARNAMIVGAGIALLPPFACAREVRDGTVIRVLPEWVGPTPQFNLVYPSARFVPQRVVLVRNYLLEELARVPWTCTETPPSAKRRGRPRVRAVIRARRR